MSDLTKTEMTDAQSDEAATTIPAESLEATALEPEPLEPRSEEPPLDSQPAPPREFSKQARRLIGAGALLLGLGIYWLRLNNMVGLFVDDAWYVLLAKALATGQGYTLINSPTAGITPLYPPGFPALLSVFYRLYPHFPENLWLLKAVSIVAMLGAGLLTYYYFSQVRQCPRHFSLWLSLGVGLCAPLVFQATSSTMSEGVFTCSLLAAVVLIEKSVQQNGAWSYLVAGTVVASFAFLTRSAGIGILAAIGIYLLMARSYRQFIVFSLLVLVLCSPWVIYSRLHAPTPEQRDEQRGAIVEPYTTQLWQRIAGDPASGEISATELPARVWNNFLGLTGRDLSRILVAPIAEDLTRESLQRRMESGDGQAVDLDAGSALSFFLAAFVLVGFVAALKARLWLSELVVVFSLLITFLWPWEVLRFVLPLTPFLLFYLARGWRVLLGLYQRLNESVNERRQWAGMSVVLGVILLINLWGVLRPLWSGSGSVVKDALSVSGIFEENRQLMQWMVESTPPDSVVAAPNPPLVYLFTGRKTISAGVPEQRWELWKKMNVVYWARTSFTPLGPISEEERRFRIAYRVPGNLELRVIDLGNPQTRNRW